MDFMQEYEKWLHSPALSPEEHAELESIKDDPKEIESRFFARWSSAPPVSGALCAPVYIT